MATKKAPKEKATERDRKAIDNTRLYEIVKTKLNREPEKIKALLDTWYASYEWLEPLRDDEVKQAKRFLAEVVVEMIEEDKL